MNNSVLFLRSLCICLINFVTFGLLLRCQLSSWFCLLCLFNDLLNVFAKSCVKCYGAQTFGEKIHFAVCCFNLVVSTNLNFSCFDMPPLFVGVTTNLVDSVISVPADLAAVVFGETLGPVDIFERSQEETAVADCFFKPSESCHGTSNGRKMTEGNNLLVQRLDDLVHHLKELVGLGHVPVVFGK